MTAVKYPPIETPVRMFLIYSRWWITLEPWLTFGWLMRVRDIYGKRMVITLPGKKCNAVPILRLLTPFYNILKPHFLNGQGVTLTTHPHLAPRRKKRTIPLLPLMACSRGKLTFTASSNKHLAIFCHLRLCISSAVTWRVDALSYRKWTDSIKIVIQPSFKLLLLFLLLQH